MLVAPYMGAWIEICPLTMNAGWMLVAPYMGAWIEIARYAPKCNKFQSLPTWERGLKSSYLYLPVKQAPVAPYMGAWIEIYLLNLIN